MANCVLHRCWNLLCWWCCLLDLVSSNSATLGRAKGKQQFRKRKSLTASINVLKMLCFKCHRLEFSVDLKELVKTGLPRSWDIN